MNFFTEFDFALTISTFLIGVAYGVEIGLPAGTIINMFSLLKPWTRPNVTVTYGTVRIVVNEYKCKHRKAFFRTKQDRIM